jgi:hypothetical protein
VESTSSYDTCGAVGDEDGAHARSQYSPVDPLTSAPSWCTDQPVLSPKWQAYLHILSPSAIRVPSRQAQTLTHSD